MSDLAKYLFNPESIAVIGASADEGKYASLPQRYLRRHGYPGRIVPINPRREEIFGEKAYPTVQAVGAPVDHAIIVLPTGAVMDAIEDCCRAGVRCATIISNGFAEVGEEGRKLQDRMVAMSREAGLRLIGPNSLGLVNLNGKVPISANEVLSLPELKAGSTALVSQSGSLLGAVLSRGNAGGIGFSKMVSVGNEADIGMEELTEILIDDPETEVILLFLETIRQADRLEAAARRAFEVGKPIVAFRLGRSEVGEKLAASHTGALTGAGASVDAFLRDCGMICVDHFETLIEIAPLVAGRRPGNGGRRVSVMTTTGGGGALVVDALARKKVEIVPASPETRVALAAKGMDISDSPLIDLTLAGANARAYGTVLAALLADTASDLVIPVVGSSAQFRPDRAVEPIVAAAKASDKPLAAFMTPQAVTSLTLLHGNDVAGFLSPEICADAVRALFDWRAPRAALRNGADIGPARALVAAAGQPVLNAAEARRVFAALGIEQPGEAVLGPDPAAWPASMGEGLRFPVVAKILSRDIQHKTEAGGVVLGIETPEALREACERMLRDVARKLPGARLEGIQVETQEKGLANVLIGYRRDPVVGPSVTVGLGGVLTELYRDFAVRPAPVSVEAAHDMIAEVIGLAVISGYRNLPRGDVDALARAVASVSRLAELEGPRVSEAEINPLIVRAEGQGAVAVDGLIVLEAH